jgi:hypothetical protein
MAQPVLQAEIGVRQMRSTPMTNTIECTIQIAVSGFGSGGWPTHKPATELRVPHPFRSFIAEWVGGHQPDLHGDQQPDQYRRLYLRRSRKHDQ